MFTVNATLVQQALGTLAQLGYEGLKAEDLGRLIQADPYEEELNVMADVMAYFHVAYKVQFFCSGDLKEYNTDLYLESHRPSPSHNRSLIE